MHDFDKTCLQDAARDAIAFVLQLSACLHLTPTPHCVTHKCCRLHLQMGIVAVNTLTMRQMALQQVRC
jgi:hypothetical protein